MPTTSAQPTTEAPRGAAPEPVHWRPGLTWFSRDGGLVRAHWLCGGRALRLTFGPNGFNALPNIAGLDTAVGDGDPSALRWEPISGGGADWLPPLTLQAVAGGERRRPIYTGGNHGSSGSASGERTAWSSGYSLLLDGQPLRDGCGSWGEHMVALVENELVAFNTIESGRRVVRQSFRVEIRAGVLDVDARVLALEDVDILADNGLQLLTKGYESGVRFHGGEHGAALLALAEGLHSGRSSAHRAWAVELESAENGRLVARMDRSAGSGDGRYVAPDAPFIRIGRRALKAYHAVVAGTRVRLGAGDSYTWRGGYLWRSLGDGSAGC